jgi:hypothetical protein
MRLDLDLDGDAPEGWTPLEAVAVIKALDEEGKVRLYSRNTPALNGWEAAGMLLWALDGDRRDLLNATEEGAP